MEKPGKRLVLEKHRVLDLTDESGDYCSKILAALGADVIRIEPPGGHPTRRIGPFCHDEPDPEKSLHWFTYNLNKKSITLNIECATGRGLFKQLVKTADFLVECFRPGYLDSLGLGCSQLSAINPRLIHTSITPYGSTGPYSQFKGTHLTISAASGMLYICGDEDRPPVQVTTPIAYLQAGLEAAAATMVADWHREQTGNGQHVDVSSQECLMHQAESTSFPWKSHGLIAHRSIVGITIPGRINVPMVFKCKDGYVLCGTTRERGRRAIREWLDCEGLAGDLFDQKWDPVFVDGIPVTVEQKAYIDGLFQSFALNHTIDELMWEGQKRDVQLTRVNDVRDVVENPHSRERGYFVEVEHPELGDTIAYGGAPFKSEEMSWGYWRRAPFIGEHNHEIYVDEMGLSQQELATLKEGGAI